MKIQGYRRKNGALGIRNHVAVIPTSVCASEVAVRISLGVPGSVALPHQHGCCQVGADFDQTLKTLGGLGSNPNVAAVLVVTLGNIAGGITTIEEKSLGCIHKAGTAVIEDVLAYADCPTGKGALRHGHPGA